MTVRLLYLTGALALLISAVAFGFAKEPLWASGAALAAACVFWFGVTQTEKSPKTTAVNSQNPSPQEVREYREEHPGTGIQEAVRELKAQG